MDYIDRESRTMNFNPLILNESVTKSWQYPLPSGMGIIPQKTRLMPPPPLSTGHLQEVACVYPARKKNDLAYPGYGGVEPHVAGTGKLNLW